MPLRGAGRLWVPGVSPRLVRIRRSEAHVAAALRVRHRPVTAGANGSRAARRKQVPTVGIVGGLGPESTIDYYRRILKAWARDDPSTSPSIVIDSLDVGRALHLVGRGPPA